MKLAIVCEINHNIEVKGEQSAECLGQMKNAYRTSLGNLKRRVHLRHLGIDGRIILKCIFKE